MMMKKVMMLTLLWSLDMSVKNGGDSCDDENGDNDDNNNEQK